MPLSSAEHHPREEQDQAWMRLALAQAQAGAHTAEVPVGAVVVRQGQLIASAYNAPIGTCDPTAHAEIRALRLAGQALKNYRLDGCTLYVTLEPCAMCSAALLHARVARVVYGAAEPKTGAAGSVINLFEIAQLNHQTQVQGGVLARECATLLQNFFHLRRHLQRTNPQRPPALRPDALRTPERCFAALAQPWQGEYVHDLPTLAGLRLHFWAHAAPGTTWVLLHDAQHWSYAFAPLAHALAQAGQRVLVPDLIGFGRSDKPKKETLHTPQWHAHILRELLQHQGVERPIFVTCQGSAALHLLMHLGIPAPEMPPNRPSIGADVVLIGTLPEGGIGDAGDAVDTLRQVPYPDAGHRAGERALARWGPLPLSSTLYASFAIRPTNVPPSPVCAQTLAHELVQYFCTSLLSSEQVPPT